MTPEQIEQMICIVGGKKLNEKIFGPPPPNNNSGCGEIGCFVELIVFVGVVILIARYVLD